MLPGLKLFTLCHSCFMFRYSPWIVQHVSRIPKRFSNQGTRPHELLFKVHLAFPVALYRSHFLSPGSSLIRTSSTEQLLKILNRTAQYRKKITGNLPGHSAGGTSSPLGLQHRPREAANRLPFRVRCTPQLPTTSVRLHTLDTHSDRKNVLIKSDACALALLSGRAS